MAITRNEIEIILNKIIEKYMQSDSATLKNADVMNDCHILLRTFAEEYYTRESPVIPLSFRLYVLLRKCLEGDFLELWQKYQIHEPYIRAYYRVPTTSMRIQDIVYCPEKQMELFIQRLVLNIDRIEAGVDMYDEQEKDIRLREYVRNVFAPAIDKAEEILALDPRDNFPKRELNLDIKGIETRCPCLLVTKVSDAPQFKYTYMCLFKDKVEHLHEGNCNKETCLLERFT